MMMMMMMMMMMKESRKRVLPPCAPPLPARRIWACALSERVLASSRAEGGLTTLHGAVRMARTTFESRRAGKAYDY